MYILGITASISLIHETNVVIGEVFGLGHDSSATLIKDGKVVFAIEEERLNRVKHTNKAPTNAIKCCLTMSGLSLKDVDYVAVNFKESTANMNLRKTELENSNVVLDNARFYIHRLLIEAVSEDIEDDKIMFIPHHLAHAASAYAMSGFDECLVFVFDGVGDNSAGIIQKRVGNQTTLLGMIPQENSLGMFYLECIKYLGYYVHDEYKVMGLAPYGDKEKYKKIFHMMYRLLPNGKFEINQVAYQLLFELGKPRRKGEPFTQVHKDIAAALQEALEDIILHIVSYYVEETGIRKLCFAGGVAQNCSANGKIYYSGLCDDMFVQPAAYDAGTSLGAALYLYYEKMNNSYDRKRISQVYWGTDIGTNNDILEKLSKWDGFIEYEYRKDILNATAELIDKGSIIAWVQGRSEFGPRALGNRSILADPRVGENKKIINQMVKKRESYRPFAPSILEESAQDYFEITNPNVKFDFMNFVLNIKKEKQALIPAITHVDGTGRIQTVSKEQNMKYWMLIDEFRKLTGIPILLNTSFNNNCEPIVDSVDDAVTTFLTTRINYLVIGDYLVRRKENNKLDYFNMYIELNRNIVIEENIGYVSFDVMEHRYSLKKNNNSKFSYPISKDIFDLLCKCETRKHLYELVKDYSMEDKNKILKSIVELWSDRLIQLIP